MADLWAGLELSSLQEPHVARVPSWAASSGTGRGVGRNVPQAVGPFEELADPARSRIGRPGNSGPSCRVIHIEALLSPHSAAASFLVVSNVEEGCAYACVCVLIGVVVEGPPLDVECGHKVIAILIKVDACFGMLPDQNALN